jgi:serine/threonine protein kinase
LCVLIWRCVIFVFF